MRDRNEIDVRRVDVSKKSPDMLVSAVLEKCQAEINSAGEWRAAVESIVKRNVRGYGLIVRRPEPAGAGKPSSIWFFPDVDLVAIESCFSHKERALSYFDTDDLDERFIWEHVSRFISELI